MVASRRRTTDPSGVPDIGQLVNQHMQLTGRSLRALERASNDRLTHGRWGQFKLNQIKEFPAADTVRTVAEVLNLPVTDVVLGFAKALGLDVRAVGPAIALPAGVDRLDNSQRRMLFQLAQSFLEAGDTAAAQTEEAERQIEAARKRYGTKKAD